MCSFSWSTGTSQCRLRSLRANPLWSIDGVYVRESPASPSIAMAYSRYEPMAYGVPDVPRRLALGNFEHLVSLSSEHTDRQTDSWKHCMDRSLNCDHVFVGSDSNRRNARFKLKSPVSSPQHWNDWAYETRRHVCANVSFFINSLSIGRLISSEVC